MQTVTGKQRESNLASVEEGRRVLRSEADALHALAQTLDQNFDAVVQKFCAITGRVIVSGMGKSGHVGRKIAATLASTGTPAYFVHPGEASHGDLGMIAPDDAVLALSNSGETFELGDLIAYTRRFQIPLIAITSGLESELAQRADIALLLPKLPEACPLELAPMTSTTLMLGLGDALAAALMTARGFTAEDYSHFHPGGKLGRKLLKVSDVMHAGDELPLCAPETPMSEVLVLISAKRFGCVGVVAKNKLIGIITDGDLRRHMSEHLLNERADAVMTAAPRTVRPNALAAEALAQISGRITCLFVVDDGGAPIGIVHIHDLLRAGVV